MKTYSDSEVSVGKSFSDSDVTINQPINAVAEEPVQKESGNTLQNLLNVSAKDRLSALVTGGITASAGGAKDSEDILPAINGLLGGIAGSYLGKPNLGIGLGTSLGEFEKQGVEKLSGERKNIDINKIILSGGAAAASSKLMELGFKAVGVSKNIIPERSRAEFFDKALKAVEIGKQKLSSNFGKSVNALVEKYPTQMVDLREPLGTIKKMLEGVGEENLVPQLKTAVRNSPKLLDAVNDTSKALNLNLKEALELKNAITSTTNSITRKAIKGKSTPNERVVFEILDQIDDHITKPFKEMREIRSAYAIGKKAYDLVRPLLEPGTAVENSIFSRPEGLFGLGGSQFMGSTHGKLAFKDIANMTKPGGKMFEAAEFAHNLNRVADTVGRIGQIAVGGSILNKLLGRDDRQ